MNASADFLYLKELKSINYHRNLLYLAIEECFKLQKETQLNICVKTSDQFVSKKKERKKENRNNHMIIISLLSCKDEFYALFIVFHMFQ